MMAAMPSEDARNRYTQSFNSKIFEPLPAQQAGRQVPAGKRRDQTTSELFGQYNDKELRAMPKTFEPKDDGLSATQKKQQFLSSDVLPHSSHGPPPPHMQSSAKQGMMNMPSPLRSGFGDTYVEAESDETIYPKMRRQMEHSSELFGRETPAVTHDQVHDSSRRLTPSDFKWFSIPEKKLEGGGPVPDQEISHKSRWYNEKCSQVFDHRSPQESDAHLVNLRAADKQAREEDAVGDLKRRNNAYYSDLFGRETPMDMPAASDSQYRPKQYAHPEDRITVHQDWTDSKTELVCGSRPSTADAHPSHRKGAELHKKRIFGHDGQGGPDAQGGGYNAQNLEPVSYDNSHKVKNAIGMQPQHIHQAHLRTSMMANEFYETANNTKHWEVVELHISGLSYYTDEKAVRDLCNGFDLQIVKVAVEMDPVRNLCKGRAKIMVRYNPVRDSIAGLVQKLEELKLTVGI
eukprot:TRINITY_DN18036_c0_g1_i1.p1 TRINITY_DN18036_c0_g1~~TRINITY_DN18036_c0_g1_i1.p1  ORF type:complete len:460 (+),score=97.46 TRINITY_DN18036_c0_g1_i1:77-1456(+)